MCARNESRDNISGFRNIDETLETIGTKSALSATKRFEFRFAHRTIESQPTDPKRNESFPPTLSLVPSPKFETRRLRLHRNYPFGRLLHQYIFSFRVFVNRIIKEYLTLFVESKWRLRSSFLAQETLSAYSMLIRGRSSLFTT